MKWHRTLGIAAILTAWSLVALWQYREYSQECDAAREVVRGQAESLMHALVGGIRSHPRLGYFYAEQLQGILEELVKSRDVLAAAVTTESGQVAISAGETALLHLEGGVPPGEAWLGDGYRLAETFRIPTTSAAGGGGRGPGLGRGMRRAVPGDSSSEFPAGGQGTAVLMIDRSQADKQQQHAARVRLLMTVAGGVVLGALALAWRATVRLTAAQGRNRLLETETRHLRELGQAAAGLAHETRGPLGLIRGWTQRLAASEFQSPEQHQHAQAVVEECDRVTARINQFLAFARPASPKLGAVDLASLLQELHVILAPDLDAKHLELQVDAKVVVRADCELLRQALFNLIANAISSAPEGSTIDVAFRRMSGGQGVIEVADRGPGVPAEAVASLFTPYFTTRSDGHGLGLAIVRRIAAAHDWRASYTPRGDGGAQFRLEGIECES